MFAKVEFEHRFPWLERQGYEPWVWSSPYYGLASRLHIVLCLQVSRRNRRNLRHPEGHTLTELCQRSVRHHKSHHKSRMWALSRGRPRSSWIVGLHWNFGFYLALPHGLTMPSEPLVPRRDERPIQPSTRHQQPASFPSPMPTRRLPGRARRPSGPRAGRSDPFLFSARYLL